MQVIKPFYSVGLNIEMYSNNFLISRKLSEGIGVCQTVQSLQRLLSTPPHPLGDLPDLTLRAGNLMCLTHLSK